MLTVEAAATAISAQTSKPFTLPVPITKTFSGFLMTLALAYQCAELRYLHKVLTRYLMDSLRLLFTLALTWFPPDF
jgi:hypothetical protein